LYLVVDLHWNELLIISPPLSRVFTTEFVCMNAINYLVSTFERRSIVAIVRAWRCRRTEKCDEDHGIVGAVQKRQIQIWIHIYKEIIYVYRHPCDGVESTDKDQESSYLIRSNVLGKIRTGSPPARALDAGVWRVK